jgi:hypothetical protein
MKNMDFKSLILGCIIIVSLTMFNKLTVAQTGKLPANYMKAEGKIYELKDCILLLEGWYTNNTYSFSLAISSDLKVNEYNGKVAGLLGKGSGVFFTEIIGSKATNLTDGEYKIFEKSKKLFEMTKDGEVFIDYDFKEEEGKEYPMLNGNLKLKYKDGIYNLEFKIVVEKIGEVTGQYNGSLKLYDLRENKSKPEERK